MSAIPIALLVALLALLLATAAATAVGIAVLRILRGLQRQVAALHTELTPHTEHIKLTEHVEHVEHTESPCAGTRAVIPAARRAADVEEIRAAVAEALAEERERELAEARAFWAAQEAREASEAPSSPLGLPDSEFSLPRQSDFAALEQLEPVAEPSAPSVPSAEGAEGAEGDEFAGGSALDAALAGESAELAAARRRHPSHPDFAPASSPVVNDHERTVACLDKLATSRTALADIRPGPLGTLDVYVFADGTALCITPGYRESAERLATALRTGQLPVLLGGSRVSGAYTLTFQFSGENSEENVYILADRVIASL